MKNQKQVIRIVDEFPIILYRIKGMLEYRENVNYILDASKYSRPVSLLTIVNPNIIVYDLKEHGKNGIDLLSTEMQNNPELKVGMVTNNAEAYHMSLCSTLSSEYFFDKTLDLESVTETVLRLQLN